MIGAPNQFYHQWLDYHRIDVHGCSVGTAIKVIGARIEDCYRFGIPFLEIVHGSSDTARKQGRKSIGEIIQAENVHPLIVKKIPLDQYGSRHCGNERSTATRFCLKNNPSPLERNESVLFSRFSPEFLQTKSWRPRLGWQTFGTADFFPFKPALINVAYVCEALFGLPLSPVGAGSGSIDTNLFEEVNRAVMTVVPETVIDNHPLAEFSLRANQFEAVRVYLLRGFLLSTHIAETVGCDPEFVEFCAQFGHSAKLCKCAAELTRGHRLSFLDADGDCKQIPSFKATDQVLVAQLWQRYGTEWKVARTSDDKCGYSFLYTVLPTYCAGMRCGCRSWFACRTGDPDRSELGFLGWLRTLAKQ
jgi:hypothetical protein